MGRAANGLFANEDVFEEQFQPGDVSFREGQLIRLRQSVAPVFKNKKPLHVLLLGPSGSGKTTVARRVLSEVARKGVLTSYVNCMEAASLYAVLDRIIVEHRILNSDRVSTSYKVEQISRFLGGRSFVLVLDELDRILPKHRAQLLYTLSNFGRLCIIAIASKSSFLQSIDDHVRSRFSPAIVEFSPYDVLAIQAIVLQRARIGLSDDQFSSDLAKEIALLARGDARTAIQALRRAAVNAGHRGASAIASRDVRNGWRSGVELKHAHTITLLNDHQRILFRLLQFTDMTSARLIESYRHECDLHALTAVSRRMFWYYIRELEAMGLIVGIKPAGKDSPKAYHVVTSDEAGTS